MAVVAFGGLVILGQIPRLLAVAVLLRAGAADPELAGFMPTG